MRHESQAIVTQKLLRLIDRIACLPEETAVIHADTGIDEMKLHISKEAFASMFAGREVEIYGNGSAPIVYIVIDGIEYFAGTGLFNNVSGTVVMPALETVKGGVS